MYIYLYVALLSLCHRVSGSCGVLTMSIQCCSWGPRAYMKGPNTRAPSMVGGSGNKTKERKKGSTEGDISGTPGLNQLFRGSPT